MPESALANLKDRAAFSHWVSHTIRYNDQDPVGHVNNAAMATFLEQGRTDFIYPLMKQYAGPELEIVLARLEIDYLNEFHYPGAVDIGSRVMAVGSKSLRLQHGVFLSGSDTCVATGLCVLVFFDPIARSSTNPPAALRNLLADMIAGS